MEGELTGKGTGLTCRHCGRHWELTPIGDLAASEGETEFAHIPDWYRWEREQVRRELADGTYRLDIDVDIAMMVDFKAIYKVGQGRLTHDREGFTLTGCDGRLHRRQPMPVLLLPKEGLPGGEDPPGGGGTVQTVQSRSIGKMTAG